jgi:autotransporter-associated beta strand protein
LFNVTTAAAGTASNASGSFGFYFGGTAATVTNGGSFQSYGITIQTSGYVFTIDGTGANGRSLTMTNGFDLGANTVTFANGARGTNSYTFGGPSSSGWTNAANGITANAGASIVIASTNINNSTNFGFYISSGGSLSSNAPIEIRTLVSTRVMLGSQSSGGANFNSSITNNSAGGSPLELTNSSSGTLSFNGVISGINGLVLNNSSSGKITLSAANTYSGGTTLLSASAGEITYGNSSSFGTGTITSSGSGTTNYIRALVNNVDLTNALTIDTNNTLRVGATNTGYKAIYSGVISGSGSVLYSYSGYMALAGMNNSFGGGFLLGSSGRADLAKIGMAGQNSSIGTNGVITAGLITTPSSQPIIRWVGTNDDTSDKVINIGNASGGLQLETVGDGDLTLNGNINSSGLGGPKTIYIYPYTNTSMVVSGVTNITTNTLTLNGVINDGTPGYVVNDTSISSTTIITNVVGGVTNKVTNAGVTSIALASVAGVTTNAPISGGSCIAPGTTITAVDTTNKVITLSQATTNTNSISAGLAVMNVSGATAATSLFIQPKSSAGSSYVNVVLGNASNSFSGPIVFTNSQSGLVSLLKVVKVGNPGENSSLGTATNITLGGASGSTCTLDYTGAGEISSKTLTLGGSVGTVGLSQSGSGHLKLTGNILPGTTTGARTLNLSGSTSGTGEVASDLADPNGFALTLSKSGTGTWTLSGSNSYSGLTTIPLSTALKFATVNSLSPNTSLTGSTSSTNTGTIELSAAGNYVANSYGTSNSAGNNIAFTAVNPGTTLTFTNATNTVTSSGGNSAGRSVINNSTNLSISFNGAIDIGSSTNNDAEFVTVGNITVNGSIFNTNTAALRVLTKTGAGTLFLNASNSYNGVTDVNEGALVVNGSLPTNSVTVSSNATLGGLGSIRGNITVSSNSILRPGSGATNGLLTVLGTLTVDSGGSVNLTIDNMAAYGRVSNSAPVINGTINVAASGSYVPATGNTFQLFSGAVGGTPTLNLTPLSSPYVWVTNNFTNTGLISVSNIAPVLTPYQTWLTNYPTITNFPGGVTNTNGTADPDGDGFNNNLEYAFDGNPTIGSPSLLSVSRSGSSALFSFLASTNTNSANSGAFTYFVQSTTNLSTGAWTNDSTVTVTNSTNQTNPAILLYPGYVRREFSVPATNKAFYRIQATNSQ